MINKKTLLLGALASLFASAHARAAITGANASACVATTATSGAKLLFTTTAGTGAINNDNATTANISCGLVRLSTSSPRTLFIGYNDATPTGRISCGVSVAGWDGVRVWSQSQFSDISATEPQGSFSVTIPSNMVGYVRLECTIPPGYVSNNQLFQSSVTGFTIQ